MGTRNLTQRGHARRELEALKRSGRGRIVLANAAQHRTPCRVCQLGPDQLAELERAYIAWTTVPELAQMYGVSENSIRRHAAFYSLSLFRSASIRSGYARLIAAGLEKRDDITPDHALRSLVELGKLAGYTDAGQVDPGGGSDAMSWECELRMLTRGSIRPDTEAESSPAAGLRSEDQTAPAQLTIDAEADPAEPFRAVDGGSGWPEP